ncbi:MULTISPECIES: YeiH family protein [unclassified Janthinobacterium]|uniref:YeiH family protein n=1 Tax=unclassified Janthinobacterium TaxID=2610881 RepID=UPI0025AFED10|nr:MULTISPECIES: YeiH family protein [unclassified Janthinobacterium]MDN2674942.1 YeiH family protein [Janthinobacterium sp. SUN026]MED5612941.1 YeiH family protein [Janthinobacterium sp. P210005]
MSSLSSTNTTSFSDRYGRLLPGLLLSGVIAYGAIALGKLEWMQSHGMSALTLAIMLGIVLGNSVYGRLAPTCGAGVAFSKQTLLRLGIILYGFRLTFQDIGQVGLAGIAIDALVLASTFGLAMFLGTKVFKLERNSAILIGAGSSICGAAAVMATEPVVKGRSEDVTVAVSTVVVFGTIAIFLYPLLYRWNLGWQVLGATPTAFGVYIGSTVHEVAQVVAAGKSIGQEAANAAVIAKMVRVMMLAPFLVILSAVLARSKARSGNGGHDKAAKLAIPWFAFIFIGVVAFNSLGLLPASMVATITDIDTALLAMAMAALGLTTHMSAIRRAGIKPLLLAGLLFCWLIAGGAAINHVVASLFA